MALLTKHAIDFNGASREYEVWERNISRPAPQYWISYNAGKVFVSDEVPEQFRPFMVMHELYEFETYKGRPFQCVRALLKEMQLVSDDQFPAYVRFRKDVFSNLVGFLERHEPTSSFLPHAKESLGLLELWCSQ